MLYLIAYDLNAEGQNYKTVIQAIESLAVSEDDCCPIQRSVWIVRSDKPSESAVLETLKPAMDDNDQCFITRLGRYPESVMKPEIKAQINRIIKRNIASDVKPYLF
ncbi:MAG: hypothetical protein IJQ81_11255 [Oscillibacter sp.]|nr:hypothetical protein [Oscillibacter sp.]